MQPQSRRTFTIGWTAGALIVLCCQIVALAIPPATTGSQRVILIGPAAVVLAALPVDFLILWLIRRNGATDVPVGRFNRLGRLIGIATTGLLGSFVTIIAVTMSVNLTIAQVARFAN
jgi:hypothetical protein